VQFNRIQIESKARLGPCRQLCSPGPCRLFDERRFDALEVLLREPGALHG
jgi:hypothetical protein